MKSDSPPEVKYSQKMSQKSNMIVLALDLEDPSTSEGMIRVCKSWFLMFLRFQLTESRELPYLVTRDFLKKVDFVLIYDRVQFQFERP